MDSARQCGSASTVNFFVLRGDANHDGIINAADYIAIDNGSNSRSIDGISQNGDFNYDGKINGDDYTLIEQCIQYSSRDDAGYRPFSGSIETSAAIQLTTICYYFSSRQTWQARQTRG